MITVAYLGAFAALVWFAKVAMDQPRKVLPVTGGQEPSIDPELSDHRLILELIKSFEARGVDTTDLRDAGRLLYQKAESQQKVSTL